MDRRISAAWSHARPAWLVVWLAALWLWRPTAKAEESRTTARLQYSVPAEQSCPNEQSFRDIVAGRLGYDPFEKDAPLAIEATIEKYGAGLQGRVRVTNERGEDAGARNVESTAQDCVEIATSMAIAISISIDPLGESSPKPEASPLESKKPASVAPNAPAASPQQRVGPILRPKLREAGPRRQLRFSAHAGVAAAFGLTPGWSLGPRAGAGIRGDWFSVILDGNLDLMPSLATTESKHRVRASVATLGPTGCFHFGPGVGCAGTQLGLFQAIGEDVAVPEQKGGLYVTEDIHGGIDLPFWSVLSLRALAFVRVPLTRPSLIADHRVIWAAPPISGGLSLGLGLSFP